MAGYKRKLKNGKWELTISIGQSQNGKRLRKYKTVTAKNEYDAEKKLAEFLVENNYNRIGSDMLLSDYIKYWKEHYVVKLKKNTVYSYTYQAQKVHECLGHLRLRDITVRHIKLFVCQIHNYAPATQKTIMAITSNIFTNAYQDELIQANPCSRVKISGSSPKRKILNIEEVSEFLRALDGLKPSFKTLISIGVYTGLRKGEAMALSWQDIDLVNRHIKVNKQYTYNVNDRNFFDTPKTASSCRLVSMPDALVSVFLGYKKYWKVFCEKHNIQSEYMFITKNGRLYGHNKVGEALRKLLKAKGLPRITFHDLRHLHASLTISAGANLTEVAEQLGHTDIITLAKIYAHNVKKLDANIINGDMKH